MATVSKRIADDIIAGKFDDGELIVDRIIRYTTPEGGEAYGVIHRGEDPDKYRASMYVVDPEIYWVRP